MQFGLTSEQQLLVDSVRQFVDTELMPYEQEVERTDQVRPELIRQIHERALKAGFYAANMPEELGGGGLDHVALALMERELGRTSFALQYAVARPSNILRACKGPQIEHYLLPAIRGARVECLAMNRAQRRLRPALHEDQGRARRRPLPRQRHQALHLLRRRRRLHRAVRRHRQEETARGSKKKITSFLVDKDTPAWKCEWDRSRSRIAASTIAS
jgi:acyl-CoA dehydrogenase